MRTLHAFYDLVTNPLTFDMMFFVAGAHAAVKANNLDGYICYVVLPPKTDSGEYSWRMATNKDKAMDAAERMRRVTTILAELPKFDPLCLGVTVLLDRRAGQSIFLTSPDDFVFPAGYQMYQEAYSYFATPERLWKTIVGTNTKLVEDTLQVTPVAGRFVTVDYRHTNIQPEKAPPATTMNLVVRDLLDSGMNVVHVSDKPLAERLALMAGASCHFAMSGGPNMLAWFMPNAKARLWLPKGDESGIPAAHRLKLLGMDSYGQWPTANENRKFVWYDRENLPDPSAMVSEILAVCGEANGE